MSEIKLEVKQAEKGPDMIKEINSWGILDGVTTNPSLIAKEGVDVRTRIKEIAAVVDGPISAEAMSVKIILLALMAKDLYIFPINSLAFSESVPTTILSGCFVPSSGYLPFA